MVADLEELANDAMKELRKTAIDATVSLSNLPGFKEVPRVTDYTPKFTTADRQSWILTIEGLFPSSSDPGDQSRLRIGTEVYRPMSENLKTIRFEVPANRFPRPDGSTALKATAIELSMDYRRGPLSTHRTATFSVLIGSLHPTPGRFLLETGLKPQPEQDGAFFIDAIAPYGYDDKPEVTEFTGPDESSRRIVADSAKCSHLPDHTPTLSRWTSEIVSTDPQMKVKVTMWPSLSSLPDGKLKLLCTYKTIGHAITEELVLRWGDQLSRKVTPGDWKVSFDGYGGQHIEAAKPDNFSLFRVGHSGDSVQVAARPLSDLEFETGPTARSEDPVDERIKRLLDFVLNRRVEGAAVTDPAPSITKVGVGAMFLWTFSAGSRLCSVPSTTGTRRSSLAHSSSLVPRS